MLYIKGDKEKQMINNLTKGGLKSICRVTSTGDFAYASKYADT